jgi:hypothetical protein
MFVLYFHLSREFSLKSSRFASLLVRVSYFVVLCLRLRRCRPLVLDIIGHATYYPEQLHIRCHCHRNWFWLYKIRFHRRYAEVLFLTNTSCSEIGRSFSTMSSTTIIELQSESSTLSASIPGQQETSPIRTSPEPRAEVSTSSLPPTDHSKQAYLVLACCTLIQAPIWGMQEL